MAIALRFISGKYQGGEFALEDNREVVIGRSTDLDMVLVDEMVSRRHAKLVLKGNHVELSDLGSTNGVFVNGERVKQASVAVGDRILVGSNILRVVELDSGAPSKPALVVSPSDAPQPNRRQVRRPLGESASEIRMSGSLDEIPLPDLLQLFGSSRKDGVLWVDNGDLVGRIVLRNGKIRHAQIDKSDGTPEALAVPKSIYRMLAWEHGVFELDPPTGKTYPDSAELTVQEVLMEGFRQKDELADLQSKLPKGQTKLTLANPLDVPLRDLEPLELDTLQLAINTGTVDGVNSGSSLTDLDTARILIKLMKQGYLRGS
jgi:pSer/pThr/pTyr-binding forkhead associated (FHA) protein